MKVLYVIDSLVASGGAEQAVAVMAPHYAARGVQLTVVSLSERPGLHQRLRVAGADVPPAVVGARPAQLVRLTALLRKARPDLVHTTLFEADVLGRTAAALVGIPAVSSLVNASYGPEHRSDPGVRRSRLVAAQALDAATARGVRRFHALTEHVADTMARRLFIPRTRIDVIPRGRDATVLGRRTWKRTEEVRRRLGLPLRAPVVIAAARQEHQKGLDVLVEAFDLLLHKQHDAWLVLAGRDGGATPRLRAAIEHLTQPERVVLLGVREDVPDLLAAADVLAVPSRWEGLGSTAIEGMGLGMPVVASDVAALRETLGSNECGWLVPVGDPRTLCSALDEALGEKGTARAQNALARFRERYEITGVVEQMLRFYARALGDSGPRSAQR